MKISISVEGEPEEVGFGLERIGRSIRSEFRSSGIGNSARGQEQSLDATVIRKVWNRITPKAQGAMKVLWDHPEGLTKEEIVGAVDPLSDTRDLGGALSSIARVCKALKVPNNQQAIYVKHEAPDGRILYKLTDDARELITEFMLPQ